MATDPDKTINDILNEALTRWADLTGVDLDNRSWTLGGGKLWTPRNIQKYTQAIADARDLDPSGLTAFMMLRGVFESYIKEISFSAYDLMLDPAAVADALEPMRDIRDILEGEQVVDLISRFQKKMLEAAAFYGHEEPDQIKGWTDSKLDLSFIRRDALLAMERLKAHQFSQGEPEPSKFKVNRGVYEFWNINSLLAALRSQGFDGITLCLIRDPDVLWSYFAFAIKAGETITVLTDKADTPHPAHKEMSRSRAVMRGFERRAGQFWFPYDLLGLEVSEDQKALYAKARTALVPKNAQAVQISSLGDCGPGTLIWLAMMFELIFDEYGRNHRLLPELSYTGEMLVNPHALVGEHDALVKQGFYKPLELPPTTAETLATETIMETIGMEGYTTRIRPTNNDWMVERYKDRVPQDMLNVVGELNATRLLTTMDDSDEVDEAFSRETWLTKLGGDRVASWEDKDQRAHQIKLRSMDPVEFGTAEQLQKDVAWTGRWNQAKAIQRLANVEFKDTVDEMRKWYLDAVKANDEVVLEAVIRGTLVLPTYGYAVGTFGDERREEECLKQKEDVRWSRAYREAIPPGWMGPNIFKGALLGGYNNHLDCDLTCYDRPDVKATIFTHIEIKTPEAISFVTGVPIEELPWPFQHYHRGRMYGGNSILARMDPATFNLYNPWVPRTWQGVRGMNLNIAVALCKRAYNARRKALGLERKKWEPRPKRMLEGRGW